MTLRIGKGYRSGKITGIGKMPGHSRKEQPGIA
jgi:hypothetical protein